MRGQKGDQLRQIKGNRFGAALRNSFLTIRAAPIMSLYYTRSTLRTEMRFSSPLYPRVWKIRFVFLENSEIPYEVVGDLSLKAFKMLETQIRNV